jgi:hypothetical protein
MGRKGQNESHKFYGNNLLLKKMGCSVQKLKLMIDGFYKVYNSYSMKFIVLLTLTVFNTETFIVLFWQ